MLLDGCDDLPDAICNLLKINRRNTGLGQTEPFCMLHQMINMCRVDQGFTRNTSEMKTIPPQGRFFLDQQRFGTQLGSTLCNRQTGCAATDDTDIIIKVSHLYLPSLRWICSHFRPQEHGWCNFFVSHLLDLKRSAPLQPLYHPRTLKPFYFIRRNKNPNLTCKGI